MALYGVSSLSGGSEGAISTTFRSIWSVAAPGASMRRIRIGDFSLGPDGAPGGTDTSMDWDLSRLTAAGTSTAQTPAPLDSADAACVAVGGVNHTVEPTAGTLNLWGVTLNQRNSMRWACAPGFEFVIPATANAGLMLRVKSPGTTGTAAASVIFQE
jgi:hypothetical protein